MLSLKNSNRTFFRADNALVGIKGKITHSCYGGVMQSYVKPQKLGLKAVFRQLLGRDNQIRIHHSGFIIFPNHLTDLMKTCIRSALSFIILSVT